MSNVAVGPGSFAYASRSVRTQPLLEPVKREDVVSRLSRGEVFDVVVIGGGRHGSAVAHAAAANGLSVAVLEAGDFAGQTSSRLSDICHGGLRYLKTGDFSQVFQGIRDREQMFRTAHHIVKPAWFDIPVAPKDWWSRVELGIGLRLYDYFITNTERAHRWVPANKVDPDVRRFLGRPIAGAYRYCDGLMKSVRVVMESLCAARENGALTLNYARVRDVVKEDHVQAVNWVDNLTGQPGTVRGRVVINCAGPWISDIPGIGGDIKVRYSQGTHLVFDVAWKHTCMYMPLPGGRSYFILPSPAGTVVGTTERELLDSPDDAHPMRDETDEILGRLERDLPRSGLNRDSMVFGYAGVRTLPVRKKVGPTSKVSRKDEWIRGGDNVFSLSGGKFTTGNSTADKAMRLAFPLLGRRDNPVPVGEQLFPGAVGYSSRVEEFRGACVARSVPSQTVEAVVGRLGGLSAFLPELDPDLKVVGGRVLLAEVLYHMRYEQALTVNDLLRFRLRADLEKGNGVGLLNAVAAIVSRERPDHDVDGDIQNYLAHVDRARSSLGLTNR